MSYTIYALFISILLHIITISSFFMIPFTIYKKDEIVLDIAIFQPMINQPIENTIPQIENRVITTPIVANSNIIKEIIKQPIKKIPKKITEPKENIKQKIKPKNDESIDKTLITKEIKEQNTIKHSELDSSKTQTINSNKIDKPIEKEQNIYNYSKEYIKNNFENIIRAILKYKTYPYQAKKRGIEGEVLVSCIFTKSGIIENIKIVKSSTFKILDDNSIEILKIASKEFDIPNEDIELILPFKYYLD